VTLGRGKHTDALHPSNTRELARRELPPDTEAAFQAFIQKAFADGALPAKVMAVAVAHAIQGHTASGGTRRRHYGRAPQRKNSWRRSGPRLKCEQAGRSFCPCN